MTRRRYIITAGLLAATVVAGVVALTLPREPAWDGQPLSDWLQIGYGTGMTHGDTDRDDADAAVRHIGTAALPILVRELGAKHSHTRWRLVQFLQSHSIYCLRYPYPDERRSRAVGAFHALRGVATPALPEIRRYLSDPELQSDAQSAIDAILEIDEVTQPNQSAAAPMRIVKRVVKVASGFSFLS